MSNPKFQKMRALKDKFRQMSAKEREIISVCFLKAKLEVNSDDEMKQVKDFLADFTINLSSENLDHIINYLHSTSDKLPEFLAMEDSLSEMDTLNEARNFEKPILPEYNKEEAETLKEEEPPIKD
jgi:hypothetical protein